MADEYIPVALDIDEELETVLYSDEPMTADLELGGGADGFSPMARVVKNGSVATITITDKDGTTTAEVYDGEDGARGARGEDGQSCTHYWDGTTLNVTSASGTSSANLKGEPGVAGVDGQDGFSPTVSISKSGKATTITITDKDGAKTATIYDGEDGSGGGGGEVIDVEDWGGEWATQESINGSQVYTRLFSWGITSAAVDPPGEQYYFGVSYKVIRANAWVEDGPNVRPLPYVTGATNDMTACSIDIGSEFCTVYDGNGTYTGYTLYLQIWYTK